MPVRNNDIYYEQDRRAPTTHLTMVFHGAGTQQDPEGKCGLARFAAKLLFRGTQKMGREEIARRLELLGADAGAFVTETDFVVSLHGFTKSLGEALELVATILSDAAFPEDELALLKKSELNQLEALFQDPERFLSAGHQFVVYDGKEIGKVGSREGIASISREDVLEFFRKAKASAVLYFTAISDLPEGELEQFLARIIDERRTDGFTILPEVHFTEPETRRAAIIHSAEAKNDRLIWSHAGIGAADERRFALGLVVDALGSFEGYLFDELRNKKGWCYGAYAYVVPGTTRPGRIGYYADPAQENSVLLIPELLRLLREFPASEGFLGRLRERNETFKNRYAYQLDPKFRLASRVHFDRYGVPILGRKEYNDRIDAVTIESVQRVVGELFDTSRMAMVFHGDRDRITRALAAADPEIAVTVLQKEELVA
ncbi:MAG TPA: pitrilysin family protein [Bacteroidota bacterium]|nr:pitrilysin family protein [Bacteroidota bacterium]